VGKPTGWHKGLKVTSDARGLVSHAPLALARLMADICGLTCGIGRLFTGGRIDKLDRGVALIEAAVAIVGGATRLCDPERMLARHGEVFGRPASDTTLWRALGEAADDTLQGLIGGARACARRKVWDWLAARPGGFPWARAGGKTLTGWLVVDVDATLVEAHSDKEGAAGTFKRGYGHHPLCAWLANTCENLAALLRPGNAGSNNAADHKIVLNAAFAQLPRAQGLMRRLVRIDGAGTTHETIEHLASLATARTQVFFTCGWAITPVDEKAIAALPAGAWDAYIEQDGTVRMVLGPDGRRVQYGGVAELTGLDERVGLWPAGTRLIARRVPITARDKELTDFEKKTGWRYHITATNIGDRGLVGVPGSGHAQWIDALHRQHAIVEDRVRTTKACGLERLPSTLFTVNTGWLTAIGIGVDLDTWCRLLGFCGTDLEHAEAADHAPTRLGRLRQTRPPRPPAVPALGTHRPRLRAHHPSLGPHLRPRPHLASYLLSYPCDVETPDPTRPVEAGRPQRPAVYRPTPSLIRPGTRHY
jgi:hypothetical protein